MAGRTKRAFRTLNERLGAASAQDSPTITDEDSVLWLLERGTLLQDLGDYTLSARDLGLADENLEMLDITREKSVDIARYIYSDSAVTYRAPPFERLNLNSLNMLNYLVLGDYENARVEARRFFVFDDFVKTDEDRDVLAGTVAFGCYLAGVTFEGSGDYEAAARHYARAWRLGYRGPELRDRLVALFRTTGPSPAGRQAKSLAEIVAAAKEAGPLSPADYRAGFVDGQLVAVVQTGWVPRRIPERIPLATLVLWAGLVIEGPRLSDADEHAVGKLLAEGVVKWVNFPVLEKGGTPPPANPVLSVDGKALPPGPETNVAADAVAQYERDKGAIAVSAITRLLVRFGAGKATEAAVKEGAGKRKNADTAAWLTGLLVEGTLTALDRPDTRGWTLLPGRIRIYRTKLAPGPHHVSVNVRGAREEADVTVRENGASVLSFSRIR